MTLAEKVLRAKTDYDEVYSAGVDAGKAQGGSVPVWAQNVSNVKFTSDEWAQEETTIYIPTLSDISNMFWNVQITKIKKLTIKSDTPITYATNAFFAPQVTNNEVPSVLETLVLDCDFSQCTRFDNWTMRQRNLKRIEGQPFNLSGAAGFNGFTAYAYSVEYFRVVPNTIKVSFDIKHCSKLDDGTIQSVVDGLADLTDGDSQTLSLHADVIAKLTDDQLTVIAQKNWNVA